MTEKEIIQILSYRDLNYKTNNIIIKNVSDFHIFNEIPDICFINTDNMELNIDYAVNVKIDFNKINIQDIFSYVINYLKELKKIDKSINDNIKFNNKFDILKFQSVLKNQNLNVQIICKNIECLNEKNQMLFNELYYYNSEFYSVISFINKNFKTYFLTNNRILDDRENYQNFELIYELDKIKCKTK